MENSKLLIDGFTLSCILNKLMMSSIDLEGFLIGSTISNVQKSIQDDIEYEYIEQTVKIEGIISYGQSFSFYDSIGNIDTLKLPKEPILGWFKWRKNTNLRETLRELTIHRQLMNIYPKRVFFYLLIFSN